MFTNENNHEDLDSCNRELLSGYRRLDKESQIRESRAFVEKMVTRRSIRNFSTESVPLEIIQNAVRVAGTAPSGANKQPWYFAIVCNQALKTRIRVCAEREETQFYSHRAPTEWLNDLKPFGTDANKPHLGKAPYLIAVFAELYGTNGQSDRKTSHYYVSESVGIAVGMLITALHLSGLGTLTHTPSPMRFLNDLLGLPRRFRPIVIVAVGFPEEPILVPKLSKKTLDEISKVY